MKVVAAVLLTMVVALAGCGGGDDGGSAKKDDPPQTTVTPEPDAPATDGTPAPPETTPAEPEGYTGGFTEETKKKFVEGCSSSGQANEEKCRCLIDHIAEKVPFEDFQTPTAKFTRELQAGSKKCGIAG